MRDWGSVLSRWVVQNDAAGSPGRVRSWGRRHRHALRAAALWAFPVVMGFAAGCASPAVRGGDSTDRHAVIDRIVSTTAKIVVERAGERVASGSGVVVASSGDGEEPATFVLTAAHLFQGHPDTAVYVRFMGPAAGRGKLPARVLRRGDVDSLDLALLRVPGVALAPAPLVAGADVRLGEAILIVGFPWGKRLALSSGIVSQVPMETTSDGGAEDRTGPSIMVDASVGNGVSGGGVYQEATGRLLGVVEGYRTASVAFKDRAQTFSFKVPMPGETFVIAVDQIRAFLKDAGVRAEGE